MRLASFSAAERPISSESQNRHGTDVSETQIDLIFDITVVDAPICFAQNQQKKNTGLPGHRRQYVCDFYDILGIERLIRRYDLRTTRRKPDILPGISATTIYRKFDL